MTRVIKIAVVAVLALSIGVWAGKGAESRSAAAAAPAAYPTAEGVSYLPSQVVNQAKDVEPLPATF